MHYDMAVIDILGPNKHCWSLLIAYIPPDMPYIVNRCDNKNVHYVYRLCME